MALGLLALNDVQEAPMATGSNAWIDDELSGCRLADERLGRRLRTLLEQLAGAMGDGIPLACQDWAATKAAYRFFANDRVNEGHILAGHFAATRRRCRGGRRPDPGPSRHHRVHLPARAPGEIGQIVRAEQRPGHASSACTPCAGC